MEQLPPDYLAEIGRQLSTLSAFLGGFAITFVGTLLTIDSPRPQTAWATAAASIAAGAFVMAVVAATTLAIVLYPSAPSHVKQTSTLTVARIVAVLAFLVGMYALLVSLGLSGWIRSTRLGRVTTSVAIVAAFIATWVLMSL